MKLGNGRNFGDFGHGDGGGGTGECKGRLEDL